MQQSSFEHKGTTYTVLSSLIEGDYPEMRVTFFLRGHVIYSSQEASSVSMQIEWFKEAVDKNDSQIDWENAQD